MIGARMLYLIEKENEINRAYGTDAAYCIAGTEVRIPTPNGTKIFILKEDTPQLQTLQSQRMAPEIEEQLKSIEDRLTRLQSSNKPKIAF